MEIESLATRTAHDEGAEMQVKDQFGNLTDIYITLAGLDSKLWRQVDAKRTRKIVQRMIDQNDEPLSDDTEESLAAVTLSWRGLVSNGEPYECTFERAKQLYIDAPYIADQANKFIAKRGNFIKG